MSITCKRGLGVVAMLAFLAFASTAHALNGGGSDASKMIIGDSVFALSGDIHDYLEADLDETIDSHARSGCQMIGGNIICSRRYAVPNQYDDADKSGIDTVIMNGGGNDIQFSDCRPSLDACMELLLALEEEIASLNAEMQSDGIENVIFLGYYNATGDAAELRDINNYSMDMKANTYPSMGITLVDPRDEFAGHEDEYLISDGIHPTAAGSRVLADLILEAL